MKYLITGGCGFLGSNLASEVIKKGEKLIVFDNLSRLGSENNLEWLKSLSDFTFIKGDVRNASELEEVIKNEKPEVIFHVAGQVAMTKSISDPRMDFETNTLGTFNVLNAVRLFSPDSIVMYSSTNKVYGDLEDLKYEEKDTRHILKDFPIGLNESTPLNFSSPYGCSKGAADQYMLDFYRVFGIKTVVFRHSSMYGSRQFATYDQGWVGWFCEQALLTSKNQLEKPFTISGDGKQVRDVLHADDMIDLYFKTVTSIDKIAGQAFNIGGGQENSLSLIELFDICEKELKIKLQYTKLPKRESDQKVFIADITKAKNLIDWSPKVNSREGIKGFLQWLDKKESFLKQNMDQNELSVVIPAYMEEENLKVILPRLKSVLEKIVKDSEILIIDTMTPMDKTADICAQFGATYVNRTGGNSYGDAVRTGISRSSGKYTIFMDADGSHDPEFIKNLYQERFGQDVVIASRYVEGGDTENTKLLIFMSWIVNRLYGLILNLNYKDISNSFKLYTTGDIKKLNLNSNNFDIVEEILFKLKKSKKALKVKELPFVFKKRIFGETKRNLFAFIVTYIFTVIRLRFGK